VAGAAAFLRAQDRVEEVLDDAALRAAAPLPWLADVAAFYGSLRPGPPLPRHVLEDCGDEVLRRLREAGATVGAHDLQHACRVARGLAQSGAMLRHGLYTALAERAAAQPAALPWPVLHDCALALALVRPWDADMTRCAETLRAALPLPGPSVPSEPARQDQPSADGKQDQPATADGPSKEGETGPPGPRIAGTSVAGERFGERKENQDNFHAVLDADSASLVVVDGHGKRGAAVASEVCGRLKQALLQRPAGAGAGKALADALLAADTALLLNAAIEVELSGAACAVVYVEGLAGAAAQKRLVAAHLGDCRVVLGRREGGELGAPLRWSAVRVTEDHRPGCPAEATRLVAAGARVRRAGPTMQAVPPGSLGPPRLWNRLTGMAPGLALSRGVGDALGQGCGLSPETAAVEVPLEAHDAVVVVGSDGVFDVLSDAEVLHCCRVFWPSRGAAEAAAAVVSAAARAWAARGPYRDDATCAVLFL